MKIMQKTLRFLVYSMLAMVCLFTACSDDDEGAVEAVSIEKAEAPAPGE